MFVIGSYRISIMVMYAVALHWLWSLIILFDQSALSTTPINAIFRHVHSQNGVALIFATVAFLAFLGNFARTPMLILLLVPQQIILLFTASGAIEAVWIAQYADGIFRPRTFLLADQANSIIAAIGHTAAIMAHARRLRPR